MMRDSGARSSFAQKIRGLNISDRPAWMAESAERLLRTGWQASMYGG